MTNSLKKLIDNLSEEAGVIMSEQVNDPAYRFSGTIYTGSYSLNALTSASLHGGIQDNKITVIGGEQGTGKTFVALSMCATFQKRYPDGIIVYYDTEHAVDPMTFSRFEIDTSRVLIARPKYIEGWKARAVAFLTKYASLPVSERPRAMMVLDSLGALPTKKQYDDGPSDDPSADMGRRAQAIGNAFTIMNQHLGPCFVPLIVTNHIYANTSGYGPPKKLGGGEKPLYLASVILMMSKKRLGEKGDQEGNIVTIETFKSRFTKPGKKIETVIHFDKGLDRYWGLIDIALKHGIFKSVATRIELPGGKKVYRSVIEKEPETYFTPEVMLQLEQAVNTEFRLGGEVTCPPESST